MHAPFTFTLPSLVRDIIPVAEGFAVLGLDITIVDRDLNIVATIPAEVAKHAAKLFELADGRFLARNDRLSEVFVGTRGGAIAPVFPETKFFTEVAPMLDGYIAIDSERTWIDRAGVGRWVPCDVGGLGARATAWGERIVIADYSGLDVIAPDDTRVGARRGLSAKGPPLALSPDVLAVPLADGLALVDGNLGDLARLETGEISDAYVLDGSIVITSETSVSRWSFDGDRIWDVPYAGISRAVAVGAYLVIGSWERTGALIVDRATGAAVATIAIPGNVIGAAAFGDGIAIAARGHHDVVWWRPNTDPVALPHDIEPDAIHALDRDRLVTAEGRTLSLWRTDAQGPAFVAASTTMPIDKPIVIESAVYTIEHVGRTQVRARTINGRRIGLDPTLAWRPAIDRDAALALMRGLSIGTHSTEEIGFAIGASSRAIAASLRAKKFPLVPPQAIPGYDYLGTFTTSGALVIADPAYVGKRAGGAISLALKATVREGLWHVFARNGEGNAVDRTAELVAIHPDGFAAYATEELGYIGVDSGCAGIFDKACPKRDPDAPLVEGIQFGLGAIARSGYGDGSYNVYEGRNRNEIVKIRIAFLAGSEIDRTFAAPKSARTYSAKLLFALGETVDHPKFGSGTVTAIVDGGKVDISFADGKRTLVHGKK